MTRTPIPRRRKKPRRKRPWLTRKAPQVSQFLDPRSYVTKGGRVRLFGQDYENLRWAAYRRSGGYCECGCCRQAWIGADYPHPHAGELAHRQHGSWKSDVLSEVLWKNWYCHRVTEHNPKPCPKKVMIPTMGFYAAKGLA